MDNSPLGHRSEIVTNDTIHYKRSLVCHGEEQPARAATRTALRSFSRSFDLPLLGPSGAYWLDDVPGLTCKNGTRQYPLAVGGCLVIPLP